MKYFAIICLLILASCTDPKAAQDALDDVGMKDIKIGDYAWFACSKDDWYHTSFVATNPNGKIVEGVVVQRFLFQKFDHKVFALIHVSIQGTQPFPHPEAL